MKILKKILFIFFLFTVSFVYVGRMDIHAQNVSSANKFKAVYIYNFTKFLKWPNFDDITTFKIAVLGEHPISEPLLEIAERKRVKGKKIEIVRINEITEQDNFQILFIPEIPNNRLKAIINKISGKPILTLGDTQGYCETGVIMNFVTIEEKIKFQINTNSLNKSNIKSDSKLLRLAIELY